MVSPYWGMPCVVVRAEQIVRVCGSRTILKTEKNKCSSCTVLANPGYGNIMIFPLKVRINKYTKIIYIIFHFLRLASI